MGLLLLTGVALLCGLGLGVLARFCRVEGDPVVDQIDAVLPQTQCAQCGFPGCRPYAEAIATEQAGINQCPPGGDAGIQALADLLGREVIPLNPDNGVADDGPPKVALINESTCIGCTKCVQVCPVDAIIGAAKHCHTVVAEHCTGCALCLPPLCPVDDCIELIAVEQTPTDWRWPLPVAAAAASAGRSAA